MAYYKSKRILEEEEYVAALDSIIERTFFPDLPKLKRQTKWLDYLASKDPQRLATVQSMLSENRTLTRLATEEIMTTSSSTQHVDAVNSTLSLNAFVNSHISEDNASFAEILENDHKIHRRKYHWAFETQEGAYNAAKLMLKSDGTRMTIQERKEHDKACEDKEQFLLDPRPSATLDTWNYVPKNALLFPPEAFQPTDQQRAEMDLKLLTNGPAGKCAAAPLRAPKGILYTNSRFPQVLPETQEDVEDGKLSKYEYVPMTPLLTPSDATPMMTWGAIEGTPMILDASPLNTPSFRIAPKSGREQVAIQLETSASSNIRKRKASMIRQPNSSTSHKKRTLTPAAQSLMRRMSSTRRNTPFEVKDGPKSRLLSGKHSTCSSNRPVRNKTKTPRCSRSSGASSNTDGLLSLD